MEMRLHSFLISTPDGETEVPETEGGDHPYVADSCSGYIYRSHLIVLSA